MTSKYNAVYIEHVNDIHMLVNDLIRVGAGMTSFEGIADVGSRSTYKATITFDALSDVGGNDPAHLVPLVRLVQHHILSFFPHFAYVQLVLKMNDRCEVLLTTKELNDSIKARTKQTTDVDLFAASDAAYVPAIVLA